MSAKVHKKLQYPIPRLPFSFNNPLKTDKLTNFHSLQIGVTHTALLV